MTSAPKSFIEFRGVPLLSLLLFSNLMLPLFLPVDFDRPADLTLAIVVITGFSAAYLAPATLAISSGISAGVGSSNHSGS